MVEDIDEDDPEYDPYFDDPDDRDEEDCDDDYYDDDLFGPAKEEPNCYACEDTGYERHSRRQCRECQPTRFQQWRYRISDRIRRFSWRRREAKADDPWDPPF